MRAVVSRAEHTMTARAILIDVVLWVVSAVCIGGALAFAR
jgi:hypothetical protein